VIYDIAKGDFRGRRAAGGRAAAEVLLCILPAPVPGAGARRAFYLRLFAAGNAKNLALTAAMRKLLVILNAIPRDRRPWRAPQPP
jgi:transposase